MFEFNLKDIDEPTDYRNLFFPLVHPSFLRRIIFKLIEKVPELGSHWADGYGAPAKATLIKKVFGISSEDKNKFIFYSPYEMGIKGENLEEDLKNCMKETCVREKLETDRKENNDKK